MWIIPVVGFGLAIYWFVGSIVALIGGIPFVILGICMLVKRIVCGPPKKRQWPRIPVEGWDPDWTRYCVEDGFPYLVTKKDLEWERKTGIKLDKCEMCKEGPR